PIDGPNNIADQLTQSINHGLLQGLDAGQINRVRAFAALGGDKAYEVSNVADEGATALLTLTAVTEGDLPADALASPYFILEPESEPGRLLTVVGNLKTAANDPVVLRVAKGGGGPLALGAYQSPAGLF